MPDFRGLVATLLLGACGGPVAAPAPHEGRAVAFGAVEARHACFTCHGFAGEGVGETPRLAGLNAGYLAKQLDDYARQTRPDALMAPIAQRLSDADRRAVSVYYAGLSPRITGAASAPPLYWVGDPSRDIQACASCHEGDWPGVMAAPSIRGQPRAYSVEQLERWRRGVRRNDPGDVMGRIARVLSDEEIEALARYLEHAE